MYVLASNMTDSYYEATFNAFKFWNDVLSQEKFLQGGVVDYGPDDTPNPVLIVVGVTQYPEDLPERAHAATHLRIDPNGCIKGATIKIRKVDSYDPVSFQNIMNHEVGHVLALAHSPFIADIMFRHISNDSGSTYFTPWIKKIDSGTEQALREYYGAKAKD